MTLRKTISGIFALAVAAGRILFAVQVASAHSRPIRFDPAPGAVLTAAPGEINGWYTDDIRLDPNWSYIHVTDSQGNRVDTGDTKLSSDRRQETVALKSGLGDGMYTVEWRTFDDTDGAVFGDCYNFFVGQAAADAAAKSGTTLFGGAKCNAIDLETGGGTPTPDMVATATAPAPEGGDTASTSSSGSSGVPVWALVVGIIAGVAVGGVGGRFVGSKS